MNSTASMARVELELDGSPFSLNEGLLTEVRVQQRLSLPTLCELVLSDSPGSTIALSPFRPGQQLEVWVEGRWLALFKGHITAVERVYGSGNRREVRVRAYDPLHVLRKRQSVMVHRQSTLAELAQYWVATLGMPVEAVQSGPTWEFLIQHRQSDFELLTELAERSGLYFTVRGDTLHLITLEGIDDPLPLTLGANLLEARLGWNGDSATRSATAIGWNALRVEAHTGNVTAGRSGRQVSYEVLPEAMQTTGLRMLVGEQALDADHSTALAQGELDRQLAREVTLWGVAEGDPELRPGAIVALDRADDGFNGSYVLTRATHTLNVRTGYLTELSSAPPPRRERPYSTEATLGVVTAIDGDLGRVKVALSAYEEIETEWMQVLSLGAGSKKGLIIVPDVGDEVLVLLPGGDPAQGIVLGGLFGLHGSADPGIDEGQVRRFTLLTPGGQRVRLDDTKQMIRIENSNGSFIELTPDHLQVHSTVALTLEAPGQAITLRGDTINFERAK